MNRLDFIKMQGLGNDFVVLDGRTRPVTLTRDQVRAIADRRTGVGCDLLVVLEPPRSDLADVFMRFYNGDGSESGACGNASRCIARLVTEESGADQAILETASGLLDAERRDGGLFAVDMGPARLDWREIPLAEARDTLHLDISAGPLRDPVGVNMGNPHAVFFVDDAEAVDLETHGLAVETHALFPEFTNVEAVQVLAPDRLRMRVWERGVGITQACGSGACAALVAAARRGLSGRKADVLLDGGSLTVEWLPDDHVLMTGPAEFSFTGTLAEGVLS